MEVVSTIGLITINETVIIELISFLIFLFLINRIMFRPLQDIMGEREAHIEDITAQRQNSTVTEKQRLYGQNRGHHDKARPRPQQNR